MRGRKTGRRRGGQGEILGIGKREGLSRERVRERGWIREGEGGRGIGWGRGIKKADCEGKRGLGREWRGKRGVSREGERERERCEEKGVPTTRFVQEREREREGLGGCH